MKWKAALSIGIMVLLMAASAAVMNRTPARPVPPPPEGLMPAESPPPLSASGRFMQEFMLQVNPGLAVEDPDCARGLSLAIAGLASEYQVDWSRLLALAWQESDFDCHAKNRRDKGGAYGPFQIRRLWQPVTGDPRHRYFEPDLAVQRVVQVMLYYRDTPRYSELVRRGFRNPLLCLYNSGEIRPVNMRYCRDVGRKLRLVHRAWERYQEQRVADESTGPEAVRGTGNLGG